MSTVTTEKGQQLIIKNNYGLCILRMLMCFEVVLAHFWNKRIYFLFQKFFVEMIGVAVPVFMLMSFYLTEKSFLTKSKNYVEKRIKRLIVPQIGWAIIYWSAYTLIGIALEQKNIIDISDLIWQMFTGHSPYLNPAMWYQIVIIIISLVLFLIFYFLNKIQGIISLCLLMIIALFLQYTGINYNLFSGLRYELMYPLGRICEMIPYAVIGFLVAYSGILKKCENHRFIIIFSSIVIGTINEIVRLPVAQGFGYSGIRNILIAIVLVNIAILLPLDKLSNKILNVIVVLSKYTLGVYCMHNLVGRFVSEFFAIRGLEDGSFFMCIVIYVCCYIISYIISKIPYKTFKQLVE